MIDWHNIIKSVALVVVGALIIIGIRRNESDSRDLAERNQRAAVRLVAKSSYEGDIRSWHAQLEGCGRGVKDRRAQIKLLKASSASNQAVADDNVNAANVRRLRGAEAKAQRAAVASLKRRVPPKFVCRVANPKPPTPKGIKPLP